MQLLTLCISIYAITIVFSLAIAAVLMGLGNGIKHLKLDQADELDISVPTSDSEKEQENVAIAIALAHAARTGRISLNSKPTNS